MANIQTDNRLEIIEVEDDVVIKYTPMPEIGENTYKKEVVMTKEIFQECYKKWVEPILFR